MSNAKEDSSLSETVASILQEKRENLAISYHEIERRSGISNVQIGRYLKGLRKIDLNSFEILCNALETTPLQVISEAEVPASRPADFDLFESPAFDFVDEPVPDFSELAAFEEDHSIAEEMEQRWNNQP